MGGRIIASTRLSQKIYGHLPALIHLLYLAVRSFIRNSLQSPGGNVAGGVPVVADLKSGLAEVVDHTSGILVPDNYTEGYGRAIIHFHHHREELASNSCAVRERVKKNFRTIHNRKMVRWFS